LEIRLLGAVEVVDGDRVFDCGPPQQRHVLAVLATAVGRPVTPEALIDRVWDEAPAGARRTLHVYVTRLRRLFGESLPRRSGGYVLDLDPDRVDIHRFASLVERARDGAGTWREAVALWRGEPLAGLPGQWAERTREAWRRDYVEAVLAWSEVEVAAGNPGTVVGPLAELAGDYPLTEPLAAMLVRALHAAGRSAEALDHYAKVRRRLAEQLGTDPGTELRQLHQTILRGEQPAPTQPATAVLPAQLPADAYRFAGRTDQLKELDRLLDRCADRPNAVVISAVSGTAGVGKTHS
jgi:DNA-binding SARP family transcriptional activator